VGFVFRNHKGFTLIEVLIAMAVVGVGLIALVTLFPIALESSRLAGDFTTASFVAQQALDNIRATAQVYDPADLTDEDGDDDLFDDPNGNGLGYYELPVSAVKGRLLEDIVRFPNPPRQSQWWLITMTGATTFSVTNSIAGAQGTGNVGAAFESTNKGIQFILVDNEAGSELGNPPFNEGSSPFDNSDVDYPDFEADDEIFIAIEMHAGNPYYWYAMRAPVTEDVNLDGILGGRLPSTTLPNGEPRSIPFNEVQEDIGLDLVPDFFDVNNNGAYQSGLDRPGEFSTTVPYPADPHGDNRYAYNASGWWNPSEEINPNGTEGNGQIDAFDDDDIQKVTVIVGWREGGKDRSAAFSAAIPNQFR
jgi:prepilin-type N-terminal cleavage/methylation domain-containing protein